MPLFYQRLAGKLTTLEDIKINIIILYYSIKLWQYKTGRFCGSQVHEQSTKVLVC